MPGMQDCPSHQAEDIGARFADPSSLQVLPERGKPGSE
jgi:hypothetical protein